MGYPNGTPIPLRYGGIEPTGPLPDSVDFPLVRRAESDQFDALASPIRRPANVGELEDFREDVVKELIGSDVTLGMYGPPTPLTTARFFVKMDNVDSGRRPTGATGGTEASSTTTSSSG